MYNHSDGGAKIDCRAVLPSRLAEYGLIKPDVAHRCEQAPRQAFVTSKSLSEDDRNESVRNRKSGSHLGRFGRRGSFAANKLNIGDPAPQWTGIVGTDDKPHSLADYKEAKAVVVVFTCNHCPVATAYQERLVALQKDYKDKGVQVIAICVNKGPADDLDAMKKRAESAGFNFPYLYDPTQQVGRDYGATCTPHAFVLDKDRKLAYMGAIDDDMHADKVEEALHPCGTRCLAGRQDAGNPRDPAVGCGIHYE